MDAKQESYYTIRKIGRGEYEDRKSRFLGEAIPIQTAEEAAQHLARIRKQYYDARHHCSAYVLGAGKDVIKVSDDGEPSGTAGLPILRVIEGRNCTNLMVAVTRYFGGTLLGTGGLTRAYTAAAQRALEAAEPVCMRRGEILELHVPYSLWSTVQHYIDKKAIETAGTEYAEHVICRIVVPRQQAEEVRERMQALSGGCMPVETVEEGFYGFGFDVMKGAE